MIIPDKKKLATVIMARMDSKGHSTQGPDVKPEVDIDDSTEGLKAAAEDILTALNQKSAMDLVEALKAFIDQYDSQDSDDDEQDPQS